MLPSLPRSSDFVTFSPIRTAYSCISWALKGREREREGGRGKRDDSNSLLSTNKK